VGRAGPFGDVTRFAAKYRFPIALAVAVLVAVAVGGIRIDWRGIAALAGTAAALGLWHIATDRELGARISESLIAPGIVFIVVVCVLAGVFVPVGMYFFPSWTIRELGEWVLTCVVLSSVFGMVSLLTAWMFRARWAGSLISSIRTVGQPLWWAPTYSAINAIHELGSGHPAIDRYLAGSLLALAAAATTFTLAVLPHLEVRDRGLLVRGRLISWLNIERYEWEAATEAGELVVFSMRRPANAVLRLHVRRLFSILPSPRIRVPRESQDELEAILKRHLCEWPQS
jgi:hypothetical protein